MRCQVWYNICSSDVEL